MASIPVHDSSGAVVGQALVDEEDHARLGRFRWYLANGYASRKAEAGRVHGRRVRRIVYLHREVAGLLPGDALQVGFANGDKLDCRAGNLLVRPAVSPAPRPHTRTPVAALVGRDMQEAD